LSAHKCCLPLGRSMTMASSTRSSWLTSCRRTPVTTIDSGTPPPSTSRWRFLPFFPPIRRVESGGIAGQRGLDHGPVDALPAPGDALHLAVFGQSGPPKGYKEAGLHSPHEVCVVGIGTAETLLRQGPPLAARAQHIQNGFKDLPGRHGLSAATGFTTIPLGEHTFRRWDQRFHLGPECIRDFPRL